MAPAGGRNKAGVWLACQLRDNGFSEGEARGEMEAFARDVRQPDGKPRYTATDARSTLGSVYRRPPRQPWGSAPDRFPRPPRIQYDPRALPRVDPSAFPPDATGFDFETARFLRIDDARLRDVHSREIRRDAERIAADAAGVNLDLEDAPLLPEYVFGLLPAPLQALIGAYAQRYERDVFLVAFLPMLGAMLPNVWTRQRRKTAAPTTYALVTAEAGHGKGVLDDVQRISVPLDRRLAERREREKKAWRVEAKEAKDAGYNEPPEPPDYRLSIPANSSATPFLRALRGAGGRGMIYETEARGLLNATKQDWGDYSEALLKGWPHETISLLRATEEFRIERAVLSVVLSCTPEQAVQLLPSPEDGLFSRFGVYHFVGEDAWIDQAPVSGFDAFHAGLDGMGEVLAEAYEALWARNGETLWVDIPNEEWDRLQRPFSTLKERLIERGERRLIATAHRAPGIAARMAVALTMLYHVYEGHPLNTSVRSVGVRPEAVDAAVAVAVTMADHAIRLAQRLPKEGARESTSRKTMEALALALPEKFDRAALLEAAGEVGLGKSAAYKYRTKMLQLRLAEDAGYGWCKKTAACPRSDAAADAAGEAESPDADAGAESAAPSASSYGPQDA